MRLRSWLVYQRDTNEMVILKILLRDYLVASCPAISQNIYMYPRAGEVIETTGQLGSCPQKVLASDAVFVCVFEKNECAEDCAEDCTQEWLCQDVVP